MTVPATPPSHELTRADLDLPLNELFDRLRAAQGGEGWVNLTYRDSFDSFEMRLTRSSGAGTFTKFEVGCFLNGRPARQLNGMRWSSSCSIGDAMLLASSAPAGVSVAEFFA